MPSFLKLKQAATISVEDCYVYAVRIQDTLKQMKDAFQEQVNHIQEAIKHLLENLHGRCSIFDTSW